ncbi:MAG: hypothetical protein RR220_00535 [Bacteroidaceae bacterium]
MGRTNYEKAPSFGYCASQNVYYYGYKLHSDTYEYAELAKSLSGSLVSFGNKTGEFLFPSQRGIIYMQVFILSHIPNCLSIFFKSL